MLKFYPLGKWLVNSLNRSSLTPTFNSNEENLKLAQSYLASVLEDPIFKASSNNNPKFQGKKSSLSTSTSTSTPNSTPNSMVFLHDYLYYHYLIYPLEPFDVAADFFQVELLQSLNSSTDRKDDESWTELLQSLWNFSQMLDQKVFEAWKRLVLQPGGNGEYGWVIVLGYLYFGNLLHDDAWLEERKKAVRGNLVSALSACLIQSVESFLQNDSPSDEICKNIALERILIPLLSTLLVIDENESVSPAIVDPIHRLILGLNRNNNSALSLLILHVFWGNLVFEMQGNLPLDSSISEQANVIPLQTLRKTLVTPSSRLSPIERVEFWSNSMMFLALECPNLVVKYIQLNWGSKESFLNHIRQGYSSAEFKSFISLIEDSTSQLQVEPCEPLLPKESSREEDAALNQLMEIFPSITGGKAFFSACLESLSLERTIEILFEELESSSPSSLPQSLRELLNLSEDEIVALREHQKQASSTFQNNVTSPTTREQSILSVELKNKIMEAYRRQFYNDDDDEDEDEEQNKDSSSKGKKTSSCRLLELAPSNILPFLVAALRKDQRRIPVKNSNSKSALLNVPVYSREARKTPARIQLKAQTNWSDEQLEGWHVMLMRKYGKPEELESLLQEYEFESHKTAIAANEEVAEDDEELEDFDEPGEEDAAKSSVSREFSAASSRGRGSDNNRGRGNYRGRGGSNNYNNNGNSNNNRGRGRGKRGGRGGSNRGSSNRGSNRGGGNYRGESNRGRPQ